MTSYQYDKTFFDYVDISAARSARAVVAELYQVLKPNSVLDVGCGRGVWLAEWSLCRVPDVLGIDGDYVDRKALAIPESSFRSQDISQAFSLGRKYDLVQCLEVAEHVPEAHADTLLRNLTAHGDVILFSAATPGQGGEFHVNEQPVRYWVAKFRALGFDAFDFLRARIQNRSDVEPWYRYNTLLFANSTGQTRLPADVVAAALRPDVPIPNYASISWRLRCGMIQMLPSSVVHALAQFKHKLVRARGGAR
jgi:SAM-dependent methyltransferase